MSNILHLVDRFSLGGTEKTMQILVKELNAQGEFTVHAGAWSEGGAREEALRAITPHIEIFHRDASRLVEYIHTHNIELVHVHRSNNGILEAIRAIKEQSHVKIVETNVFGKLTGDAAEQLVDFRLLVSYFCAQRLQKALNVSFEEFSRTHRVTYNPIDLSEFGTSSPEEIEIFRNTHGIAKNATVLGRVGRADDTKFGRMCIEMMPSVLKKYPNTHLLLLSASDRIAALIKRKGLEQSITILPETSSDEELNRFYHSIDVLTHSSLIGESFGCTLAEAMLSQLPIVVNSTPYFDNAQIELVDNGSTGYVVDNTRSYANAVIDLIEHPERRTQFGKEAQKKAQRYSSATIAAETMKIYEYLLHSTPLPAMNDFSEEYERRMLNVYQPRPLAAFASSIRNRVRKKIVHARR